MAREAEVAALETEKVELLEQLKREPASTPTNVPLHAGLSCPGQVDEDETLTCHAQEEVEVPMKLGESSETNAAMRCLGEDRDGMVCVCYKCSVDRLCNKTITASI